METTEIITIIISIVIPTFSFMGWVYNRIEKKADERFQKIERQFQKMDDRFEKIDERFLKIDERFLKMDEKMERGFAEVNLRFQKMDEKMERGFADLRQEIRQNRIEAILFNGGHIEIRKNGTEDKK